MKLTNVARASLEYRFPDFGARHLSFNNVLDS